MNEETIVHNIPVNVGETLIVTPQGKAKNDYFCKIFGYVVFIKDIPEGQEESAMSIMINQVRDRYAFATYQETTSSNAKKGSRSKKETL
jgi:predicted RNA-binding protein with TRAM domain